MTVGLIKKTISYGPDRRQSMTRNAREYFLMHKDIRVCLMEVTDEGDIVKKINK